MDKISGIIPSNARTRSVDTSNSQPVRPGAPTYGRPEGRVTKAVEDKVTLSSVAAERPLEKPPTYDRGLTEAKKTKIARDMTDRFFAENFPHKEENNGMSLSEDLAEQVSVPLRSSVNPESSREEIA